MGNREIGNWEIGNWEAREIRNQDIIKLGN